MKQTICFEIILELKGSSDILSRLNLYILFDLELEF